MGWRMSCNVGVTTEGFENELWGRWSDGKVWEWAELILPPLHLRHSSSSNPSTALPTSQLILQPFRCFTYVRVYSATLLSLLLRHKLFSNLSVTSPTSQLILQHFRRFTYVTAHSPTLPLFHLRQCSFSNPSFASPASQALHLIHLASCPCSEPISLKSILILSSHLRLGHTKAFFSIRSSHSNSL